MRVALVHSFYSSAQVSGENMAVERQADALRRRGHEVLVVARRTDDLEGQPGYRLRATLTTATGSGPSPVDELRAFEPDVVHVHNLFPNWGVRWCERWDGPLVATLHNFRTICAAATLTRDGAPCVLCPSGSSLNALRHRCYRDSMVATAPLAIASRRSPGKHPLLRRAERVIVLSAEAQDAFVGFGLPAEKVVHLPNFVPEGAGSPAGHRSGWLMAGRISPEKGSVRLLRSWPADVELDVVGSGPDERAARDVAPASVRFHGSIDSGQLRQMMRERVALVFPSECRENSPLVYLEALEAGLPVIALKGSWPAEDVLSNELGVVIDDLAEPQLRAAMAHVEANADRLSARCRRSFEERFAEDGWIERLLNIYAAAGARA